ncbi:MAG: IclR family transcriptional regulator [Neisseriaceae bacterium]|nr:IclR family transcriptional regulator [Neisseriaceae bacterium]MBP6861676.1 IclR family transcriptional regulator [Neisseriaceae bacterium]
MEMEERYLVPGLMRGLAILELFGHEQQALTISELAEKLGVNRSSAFRLAYTLESCGYIRKSQDSKRYTLDAKVMGLGFKYLSGLDLIEAARPILSQLRDDTSLACNLVILQDKDIVYIDQCQASGSFTSRVRVGTRWPAYATVIGQLLLSDKPTEVVEALYANETEWQSYSDKTPQGLPQLLARLEAIRGQSAMVSWGHFNHNMATCASPVFRRDDGKMVAVISASCPLGMFTEAVFHDEVKPKVIDAAERLSQQLTRHNYL